MIPYYPFDEELEKIEKWNIDDDFLALMEYVKARWQYPDYWAQETVGDITYYKIATGGWSGNEDLIAALRNNFLFWGFCWVLSKRGGYYEFEVKVYDKG